MHKIDSELKPHLKKTTAFVYKTMEDLRKKDVDLSVALGIFKGSSEMIKLAKIELDIERFAK